jgi:hypothetical protein
VTYKLQSRLSGKLGHLLLFVSAEARNLASPSVAQHAWVAARLLAQALRVGVLRCHTCMMCLSRAVACSSFLRPLHAVSSHFCP